MKQIVWSKLAHFGFFEGLSAMISTPYRMSAMIFTQPPTLSPKPECLIWDNFLGPNDPIFPP